MYVLQIGIFYNIRWGETLKGFCQLQQLLNDLAWPLEVIYIYLKLLLYILILLIFMNL